MISDCVLLHPLRKQRENLRFADRQIERACAADRLPPEETPDPSNQLVCCERFRQVIIGTKQQASYTIE